MKFIDTARLHARGGRGGAGCLSFWRDALVAFGGPDGGDGGRGGAVILEASTRLSTLLEMARNPHVEGGGGAPGRSNSKTGAEGEDRVVLVPVGTVVYRRVRGAPEGRVLIADLKAAGDRVVAAQGGRPGRGNLSFKSRVNTAPRICEKGEPGETAEIDLELKLLADVGLVGLPNAGKSTLLARVSAARPKVADYPFTTLSPHLGVISHKGAQFTAADIPGLIEGAHSGKGLGDEFLRHVERTRVLVHLVDPLGFGGDSPGEGVRVIEGELAEFGRGLAEKPRLLVVSKMDLAEGEAVLRAFRARWRKRDVMGISGATGRGVSALLDRVAYELSRAPEPPVLEPAPPPRVSEGFRVERAGPGRFSLSGRFVERAAAMLDVSLPEAIARFQRSLKRIGVDRALRLAGAVEGDLVRCGKTEFEWSDAPPRPLPRLKRHPRTRVS